MGNHTSRTRAEVSGTEEVREEVLSAREVELIRSAYRVISRKGGHRLSLQDIADEAGVSKGLIHYHFRTKDNLLLTTMRWALLRIGLRIRERMAGMEDPQEALGALIDAVFVDPERNRDFYLLYLDLVEHAARVPSFGELFLVTRNIINRHYAEIIRQGLEHGAFNVDDVDRAATAMRAYIEGIFLSWLQEEDWKGTHSHYRSLCRDGLLRLLGAT